jgi:hypothetical protein
VTILVDESQLPVIRVIHQGETSDDDFVTYLETMRRSMFSPNAGQRLLIIDATHAGSTPPTQRRLQAEWMSLHADRLRALTVGVAFIIPSSVVRGFLTAILWIQPLPCPHEVCATLEQALDWGDRQLTAHHLVTTIRARRAWLAAPSLPNARARSV